MIIIVSPHGVDDRLLRLSDQLGGGERQVVCHYDQESNRWRGKLHLPVIPTSTDVEWMVAVTAVKMPAIDFDKYPYRNIFWINLLTPTPVHRTTPICTVHYMADGFQSKAVRQMSTQCIWHPLVGGFNMGLTDVEVCISSFGEQPIPPAVTEVTLFLDFAIDEERSKRL